MRKLAGVVALVVCIPLIGTLFVKPDKRIRAQEEDDTSVINEAFEVAVREDVGTFYYQPETLTGLMMYCAISEDTTFSSSEDYIVRLDEVQDPEQEYLKALAIVCRSSIVSAWEAEQCPDVLDFDVLGFGAEGFYRIMRGDAAHENVLSDTSALSGSRVLPLDDKSIRRNEIERAVNATMGAVITRDGKVITAPFFTTPPSDILVGEAGSGAGFSLNYAYELAFSGMNFFELLKYFYEDVRVMIYE